MPTSVAPGFWLLAPDCLAAKGILETRPARARRLRFHRSDERISSSEHSEIHFPNVKQTLNGIFGANSQRDNLSLSLNASALEVTLFNRTLKCFYNCFFTFIT